MKESLSELIQRRIKNLNISKAELSRRIGVSRSYIVNMANQTAPTKSGQYEPSPEVVANLAKVLEVTEIEILNAIGYAPKNVIDFPDGLRPADFAGLDDGDLKEIKNYIGYLKYKKSQRGDQNEMSYGSSA